MNFTIHVQMTFPTVRRPPLRKYLNKKHSKLHVVGACTGAFLRAWFLLSPRHALNYKTYWTRVFYENGNQNLEFTYLNNLTAKLHAICQTLNA